MAIIRRLMDGHEPDCPGLYCAGTNGAAIRIANPMVRLSGLWSKIVSLELPTGLGWLPQQFGYPVGNGEFPALGGTDTPRR